MTRPPADAEILASIRRAQAELCAALPPEIGLKAEEVAAVQIRLEVLRARLEIPSEHETTPLLLPHLLALLAELVGHVEALETIPEDRELLMKAMRGTVLSGEIPALREELRRPRSAGP